MALSGVTLGVEIVGAEVGVKSAFAESIAAADEWAKATEAAGVQAARAFEFVGVAAGKAELAYAKLGETIVATSAKIDAADASTVEGSRAVSDAYKMQAEAAVRYQSLISGMAAKQVAANDLMVAAAERGAMKYQSALMGAGRTLTTYLTLPLGIAAYASIKLATDFQASMMRIRTYAGATQAEVNRISGMILGHAGSLPQGPVQSSEAVYHLESIGIRGKRAFDALHAAAIATGAGMANLTDATTALGGALVSTIKGASDAKTAMAGLVAIAGMGNMTMQDLSNALGTGLLAKAANVGVPLRDIGSALAVLVDRGIPARRSATYLGTTLALMAAPSKEATNALSDMGVNANSMASMLLQPNGLLHVLDMLHAGMEKVGRAQGARDLMQAFGRSRQSTGIITLVESLNAPVSNYSQKLQQYDNGVRQAAERMAAYQQTAQYKMHTALSQLEADMIKIGSGAMGPVATALKGLANSINGVVNVFDKLPAGVREAFGVLAAFLAVGGPILLGVGVVLKLFDQMGVVLQRLGYGGQKAGAEAGSGITQIGADAAAAAPEVDALTAQVEALNMALANTKLEAVSGATPFGGGLFIKSAGQGIVGSTGTLATLGAPLQEGGPQSVRLAGRVIGTTESLSPEVMSALGLGEAAIVTSGEAAGAGLFASMRSGLGNAVEGAGGVSGIMAGLGRASLYGFGGLMAGQLVQSMVPGRTGQEIARPVELAGVGAGIGTMINPGIGTAVGAGVGALAGTIMDLIHSGPSFVQAMSQDATAIKGLGAQAHQAALTISQLQLSRLQIQDQIAHQQRVVQRATTAYVNTSPGTEARVQAAHRLREAELELKVMNQQLATSNDQLTAAEKAQNAIWDQRRQKTADEINHLTDLRDHYRQVSAELKTMAADNETSTRQYAMLQQQMGGASSAAQAFAAQLLQMSQQAQSTDPHLATVLRDIAEITLATNKMPTTHQIKIMLKVSTQVDATTKNLFRIDPATGLMELNLPGLPGYVPPGGAAHHRRHAPAAPPHAMPLSTEQGIQVALARNPNDRQAIEAQIRYDRAQIARLNRLKAEGQITAQQYVTQVSAFYKDLNAMTNALKNNATSNKATSAFDKRVRDDNLLAKARLDMENGQYHEAQRLLAEDKKRLELLLKEAKNAEERNAVLRQILAVEKLQKSKEGSYQESLKLQEQQARADALAALDPSLQGPTALQLRLAREAKAQAMKAINSHTLTMQGLIDAWNVVGQANAVIAQGIKGTANLYHKQSTDAVTDAVKGLTAAQEMQLRELMAQRDAHRGSAPNDQGAAGSGAGGGGGGGGGGKPRRGGGGGGGGRPPVADAPRQSGGGSVIRIDGTMNFYGVQNIKQLEGELEKIRRQKHSRAGGRR